MCWRLALQLHVHELCNVPKGYIKVFCQVKFFWSLLVLSYLQYPWELAFFSSIILVNVLINPTVSHIVPASIDDVRVRRMQVWTWGGEFVDLPSCFFGDEFAFLPTTVLLHHCFPQARSLWFVAVLLFPSRSPSNCSSTTVYFMQWTKCASVRPEGHMLEFLDIEFTILTINTLIRHHFDLFVLIYLLMLRVTQDSFTPPYKTLLSQVEEETRGHACCDIILPRLKISCFAARRAPLNRCILK